MPEQSSKLRLSLLSPLLIRQKTGSRGLHCSVTSQYFKGSFNIFTWTFSF